MSENEKLLEVIELLEKEYGIPKVKRSGAIETMVKTILSQNTTDEARDLAYSSLRELGSWEEISSLPEEEIAKAIRTCGLQHNKARTIKEFLLWARRRNFNLDFLCENPEESLIELKRIRGIGEKTAKVFLLFYCNAPLFPIDTHISRILKRIGISEKGIDEEIPEGKHLSLHLNMIKHGRRVCKSRNPSCSSCSLRRLCDWVKENENLGS